MAEPRARARGLPAARSSDDEWQAHVTAEAARDIGRWLEARGRLHQPIATLTLAELESLASVAISRFVVLASERSREQPQQCADLRNLFTA